MVFHCLCLLKLLLECDDPAVALFGGAGLKLVDVVTDLDGEDVVTFFGDTRSFMLLTCVRRYCRC